MHHMPGVSRLGAQSALQLAVQVRVTGDVLSVFLSGMTFDVWHAGCRRNQDSNQHM